MDRNLNARRYVRVLVATVAGAGMPVASIATTGGGAAAAAPSPVPRNAPAVPRIVDYPTAPNASPAALTSGPEGKLWFTEDVSAAEIGSIDPSTGALAYHSLRQGIYAFKAQGIAVDPADHLWMSANGTYAYQYDPSTSTSENYQKYVSGSEQSVTLGPDGDMWFTGSSLIPGSFIYRVDPSSATFTPFPVAGGSGYLFGITTGPDGNLWFIDPGNNALGELDPSNGHTAEFTIPTATSSPNTITKGPDRALWFTEQGADKIGRIDPTTHAITEFDVPTAGARPRSITTGPDGNIWFTEQEHAAIGSVDPTTGVVTEYSVAGVDPNGADTFLDGITTGPDGNLWITDERDQVLKFSRSPQVVSDPSSPSVPVGSTVHFTSTARGIPAPSVQWQASRNGGATWSPIAGATSTTLSLTASPGTAADRYRAEFTNSSGAVTSTSASLTLTTHQSGYWLTGKDGGVFAFGSAPFLGSLPSEGVRPNGVIAAVAATPDGEGYWLVGADGGVFAFGDARFFGSLPSRGITPNQPVVGMAVTQDGQGYWLVSADGGVFAFGDAAFSGGGPLGGAPSVGIAAAETAMGTGYWVVDDLGGITAKGTAGSFGSLTTSIPPIRPAAPMSAVAGSADGGGYWLAGADGGVFAFGDAPFLGSLPASSPPTGVGAPVTTLASSPDGGGYWLAGADGGVFAFGDAPFLGSLPGLGLSVSSADAISSLAAQP
jgi:streptogramin lyase